MEVPFLIIKIYCEVGPAILKFEKPYICEMRD